MQTVLADDFGADADAYLGDFTHYPLLTAAQERDASLRMRVAARSCLRLLATDPDGRELLRQFCEACSQQPPRLENFAERSNYLQLRRELGELVSAGPGADAVETLLAQLQDDVAVADLLRTLEGAPWARTLDIGLAVLELRSLGSDLRDATAIALLDWQPRWRRRRRPADPELRRNLQHSVARYVASRERLVLHNVRLVYKLARAQRGRGVPLRDLLQEGCGGLLRAAEKYDARLGYRFTTYAYNWIRQSMQRACEGTGSLISYPSHVHQEINQLHRARMGQLEKTGREPDAAFLASATGLPLDKVRRLRRLNNLTVGLDQPVSEHASLTWGSALAGPTGDQPLARTERQVLGRLVEGRLGRLSEMQRRVLQARYGLLGREPQTFGQLAEQLNISGEWARQLEKSALASLRDDAGLADAYRDLES